jgi:hypothetical protein
LKLLFQHVPEAFDKFKKNPVTMEVLTASIAEFVPDLKRGVAW